MGQETGMMSKNRGSIGVSPKMLETNWGGEDGRWAVEGERAWGGEGEG